MSDPVVSRAALSRTRRATLTAGTSLLRTSARLLVAFGLLPILVRALGRPSYGAYSVIQQTVGYLVLADLRAAGTLKLTLARLQDSDDANAKQRQLGASIIVWLLTLPVVGAVGLAAGVVLPGRLDDVSLSQTTIRTAVLVTVAAVALDRGLSVGASVLRGMNVDYRTAVVGPIAIVLGGVATIGAALAGWGLIGVSAAAIVAVVLSNGPELVIARRSFSWFRPSRPDPGELKSFVGMSGWLVVGDLANLLVASSDILIVGLTLGSDVAGIYAGSQAVLRLIQGPLLEVLSSAGPGIAQLASRGAWATVVETRRLLLLATLGIGTVVGGGIVLLNAQFLRLWLGSGYYAGDRVNLLVTISALVLLMIRTDATVTDSMLAIRPRALATVGCGITGALLALGLHGHGLLGIVAGVLIGRLPLLVVAPRILKRASRSASEFDIPAWSVTRPLVVCMMSLLSAFFLAGQLIELSWIGLVIAGSAHVLLSTAAYWWVGLSGVSREALTQRARHLTRATASEHP